MKDAVINVRIESQLKDEVEVILKNLGLSSTQAINIFYQQIKLKNGIPFELILRDSEENKELKKLRWEYNELVFKNTKIPFSSRYEVNHEIQEMKNFIIDLENLNLAKNIIEIFYDSKCSVCNIEVKEITQDSDVIDTIKDIGYKYISQFSFNGNGAILHGLEQG